MAWEYLSSSLECLLTSPWSSLFNLHCLPMMYEVQHTSHLLNWHTNSRTLLCSLFAFVQNLMLKLQAFFLKGIATEFLMLLIFLLICMLSYLIYSVYCIILCIHMYILYPMLLYKSFVQKVCFPYVTPPKCLKNTFYSVCSGCSERVGRKG